MNNLQSVKSISGTKAFTEFSWEGSTARKYNLIYGWNGAGKTTVGRILSFFERKAIHLDGFEGVQFRLETEHGVVTEKDLPAGKVEVRVFDEDFVRRNLSFDTSAANSIVILGEVSVDTENEIRQLESKIEKAKEERSGLCEVLDKLPDVSGVLTACGTAVVQEFLETPLATDRYYGRRYDRRRVQSLLDDNTLREDNLESLVIDDSSALETLRQQVSCTHSEVLFREPDIAPLIGTFERGNALLRRTVAVKTIEELEDDDELRKWVREGHRIHKERDHPSCYFCTNPLPPNLLARYGAFFTEEVAKAEEEINDVVSQLHQVEQQLQEDLPDSSGFFPDIASEYMRVRSQVDDGSDRVREACRALRTGLERRRGRVQIEGSEGQEIPFPHKGFAEAEAGFAEITRLCGKQAMRLELGEGEVKKAARKLELHTVASLLCSKDYFKHAQAHKSLETSLTDLDQDIKDHQTEIAEKQAALGDMALAVEDINALIAEFLGPGEIELAVASDDKNSGYRVTSRGEPTRYLSEGEKSVVALSYFLVTLREEGCDPENTIVVLDDPVDSQDSVFLFRTYGLLKRRLGKVGQVFIFTHNHEFFNLTRDWFTSLSVYSASRLFWIEMRREGGDRRAILKDLPALLRNYKSEYQYLFYRLYARQEGIEMLDDPLVPNVARKVLENFAAFKWSCRSSADLNNIVLNMFVRDPDWHRNGVGDAVLKFLNEYSHGRDFERPVTSAVMEAPSICENVLEFIRLGDREHYDYLLKNMPN